MSQKNVPFVRLWVSDLGRGVFRGKKTSKNFGKKKIWGSAAKFWVNGHFLSEKYRKSLHNNPIFFLFPKFLKLQSFFYWNLPLVLRSQKLENEKSFNLWVSKSYQWVVVGVPEVIASDLVLLEFEIRNEPGPDNISTFFDQFLWHPASTNYLIYKAWTKADIAV